MEVMTETLEEVEPTRLPPTGRKFRLRLGDSHGQPAWLSNVILWKQNLDPERYSHDKDGIVARLGTAYVGKHGVKDFYSGPTDQPFQPFLGIWQDHEVTDDMEVPPYASYGKIHTVKEDGSAEVGDVNEM